MPAQRHVFTAAVSLACIPAADGLAAIHTGEWTLGKTNDPSRFRSHPEADAVVQINDRTNVGTLDVPCAGVGTIGWGSGTEWNRVGELVNECVASDIAFFDTAERYGGGASTAFGLGWGETERRLSAQSLRAAQLVHPGSRKAVVATKFTPSPWRKDAASVVEACRQSAERLGVEQIDLYQLHMPDIVQPLRVFGLDEEKDEKYWDGLAECYLEGLVANVGVSNYGPTMLARATEALGKRGVPLASNQINYSLLYRNSGAQATVDAGTELGVKTLAYFPLAMGLLTGKYTPTSTGASSSMSLSPPPSIENRRTPLEMADIRRYAQGVTPLVAVLREYAEKYDKSVAQVALNWVISKGAIPIPGARTLSHVHDNRGALGWRLSEDEVMRLELAADGLGFEFDGAGFKRSNSKFVGYGVERWTLN